MKKKLRLQTLILLLISFSLLTHPLTALAQTKDWETLGPELGVGMCVNEQGVATIQGLACLIANVLSVSLTLLGIVGFIMLVVGSIRWMLSGGNSQNVDKAKKTMTFAIVGLILALSSFLIINLIAQFTGVSVITNFFIPSSDTGLPGGPEWSDQGKEIKDKEMPDKDEK